MADENIQTTMTWRQLISATVCAAIAAVAIFGIPDDTKASALGSIWLAACVIIIALGGRR